MNKRQKKKKQKQMDQEEKIIIVEIEKEKTGKQILPNIVTIVSSLAAIVAILSYLGFTYHKKPQADILEQAFSAGYVSELGDRQNKYPIFNDDINNVTNYNADSNCATQIVITNDYENEILLNK